MHHAGAMIRCVESGFLNEHTNPTCTCIYLVTVEGIQKMCIGSCTIVQYQALGTCTAGYAIKDLDLGRSNNCI
jgi:hypothetical protein